MPYILALAVYVFSLHSYGANNDLPRLGDATSGLISIQQEHVLGRAWLRNLRRQADTLNIPVLTEFSENLIYRLASHSQVSDRRFEIILLDNKQLNAFAVPGGVIGINAGLFLHAKTEAQFAAVLAHELAHLSQRHFARQVEEGRKQAPIAMATLLGSIMLLATNNTEAGFAGLMTSQAAATQWALSYSRDWEREADRIGIHTLAGAQFDPQGMPNMFRQMYDAHKYSERPPEFLLTHPVTENRVSDAAGRADTIKGDILEQDMEFLLMRTRLQIQYLKQSHNLAHYQDQLRNNKDENQKPIIQYAIALLLMEQKKYRQALVQSNALILHDKNRISFQILNAQILFNVGKKDKALKQLNELLILNPDNHPLTMTYADLLIEENQLHQAALELRRHSQIRKNDPSVWQKLSEVEGKSGNTVALYRARAEYLYLNGQTDKALKQLESALKISKGNYLVSARIEQRARDISASKEEIKI
ncbi:MAG: M48 family metalloprotease [Bermanella sp.]